MLKLTDIFRGILLLPMTLKILPIILLLWLTPYIDRITDHHCGFQCNRPTTDEIFCIRQILEQKWEYNGTIHYYRLLEGL
jgi:hypothetical protein